MRRNRLTKSQKMIRSSRKKSESEKEDTMSKCKECGSELAEGAKFCGECGSKVLKPNTCPSCGAICASGMKFCTECGQNLNVSDSPIEGEKKDDLVSQMERGMVKFTIEKLGFHKIKALRLLSRELNCTAGEYFDGKSSWMVEPERAYELKREFEGIGATVEIKTYSKKEIESIKLAAEEPEYNEW